MDLFNKKKIRELEYRIKDLEMEDKAIWAYCEREVKELRKDRGMDNPWLRRLYGEIRALADYLGLEAYETQIPDEHYYTEKPMITITRLRKTSPKTKTLKRNNYAKHA